MLGLEPRTSPDEIGALPPLRYIFEFRCGAAGTRTPYLFNAIEALSQMSYSPSKSAADDGRLR